MKGEVKREGAKTQSIVRVRILSLNTREAQRVLSVYGLCVIREDRENALTYTAGGLLLQEPEGAWRSTYIEDYNYIIMYLPLSSL